MMFEERREKMKAIVYSATSTATSAVCVEVLRSVTMAMREVSLIV